MLRRAASNLDLNIGSLPAHPVSKEEDAVEYDGERVTTQGPLTRRLGVVRSSGHFG
jgi:hypothetical protein